jgi:D-alanyl-lipoteichoic acid acyltransferase DltB (MBOAT superfamily)
MIFNSFSFAVFFVLVSAAYFALPHRYRWLLLLTASCFFYMFFIPVYILILGVTIVIDYLAAIWIEGTDDPKRKRLLLSMSVASLCATLFAFKYFNFFNANVAHLAALLDWNYPIKALRIALPIGLSFHTFQGLSYVIEVYRGKQKAERHFGIYSLYVMYFPQLVAGPIERPQNMLHQFHEEKHFDLSRFGDGMLLVLWGLFKKVVVADSLALYVDAVYNSSTHHNGTTLLVATYFFAFQIYCDFSAYSDIARGVSRVYGIELMKNFETPYFSASIAEFWSRWHISLSTWFRDYLYIPLGGNRVSAPKQVRNILVVFVVSGFWHGANWTFLVWGGLHGTYLVVERLFRGASQRLAHAATVPTLWSRWSRIAGVLLTFHLTVLAWVFFRAPDVSSAFDILTRIATLPGPVFSDPILAQGAFGIVAVLGLDLFHRYADFWNDRGSYSVPFRFAYALSLLFGVVLLGIEKGTQFIYFQF